jgi:hypothetical protein
MKKGSSSPPVLYIAFLTSLCFFQCKQSHKDQQEKSAQENLVVQETLGVKSKESSLDTTSFVVLLDSMESIPDSVIKPWNEGRKWHIPLFIFKSPASSHPIQFTNPEKVEKTVQIKDQSWRCEVRKKGMIVRGPLKGAIYYQVFWTIHDSTHTHHALLRCYKLGHRLYLDRHGSSPDWEALFLSKRSFVLPDSEWKTLPPFHHVDSVIIETNYSFADFKVTKTLFPYLTLHNFLVWEGNLPELRKIGNQLYTSAKPIITDFSELLQKQYEPSALSIDSASPEAYLQMSGFYLIQSDQVIWIYARDWKKTMTDTFQHIPFDDYVFSLTVNEEGIPSDFGCTIDSPCVVREPLRLITVTIEGDSIFEIPRYNTSFYEKFYNKYISYSKWEKGKPPYDQPLHSYETFIKSYPLLIIKDPFHRYVRAFRKSYLPNLFHRSSS